MVLADRTAATIAVRFRIGPNVDVSSGAATLDQMAKIALGLLKLTVPSGGPRQVIDASFGIRLTELATTMPPCLQTGTLCRYGGFRSCCRPSRIDDAHHHPTNGHDRRNRR